MEKRCPYCGVELIVTTLGRYFCPNHGILDKSEVDQPEESEEEEPKYVR